MVADLVQFRTIDRELIFDEELSLVVRFSDCRDALSKLTVRRPPAGVRQELVLFDFGPSAEINLLALEKMAFLKILDAILL